MVHRAGQLIADKIRLVRPLGAGGMGQVWLANHLMLDTEVAVKLIGAQHAANPDAIGRFRREAAAAAKMKCPHGVQILDFGVSDGTPYIVMELLEGEDLAHRIQRAGPLPVAFVAEVVSQVCKALSRAHSLGIVHRDIKPENVFISEQHGDRLIKVLDFGIAKRREDVDLGLTTTGVALGSPYYMSPEQVVSAKSVDPRSDLWSLGVVAYQALTGKLPFVGETPGALAIAINEGKYAPASSVRAGLPAAVDAWFERVLIKDPGARFQSAKETAERFARALGRSGYEDTLAEAETVVGPCPDAKPECLEHCPIADLAPVQALSGTHMAASVSAARPRPRSPLLWGVGVGVLLFTVIGLAAAGGTLRARAAQAADAEAAAPPLGAAAAPTEEPSGPPAPSASVAPVAAEKPAAAEPSSSSAKPLATTAKPRVTPTRKKKDRGF